MNAIRRPGKHAYRYRIHVVLVAMLVVLGTLAGSLYIVQVARGHTYQTDLDKQSTRRVRIPAMRGRITARNGEVLADNRPSYGIGIYLEELALTYKAKMSKRETIKHVMDLVEELSRVLEAPAEVDARDVGIHLEMRRPLPIVAWRDISEVDLARFAERAGTVPGVDIIVDVMRTYPEGDLASHVIGYVGRTKMVDDTEVRYHFDAMQMVGRRGVERVHDERLRGEAGEQLLRVDVFGYKFEDLGLRHPEAGAEIQLAIDLDAQELTESVLEGVEGAAVVLDPNNGDVLALATAPSYDINSFVPFMSHAVWRSVTNHPGKPMVNRATAGLYPPGSIFKPIVAFAALEQGAVSERTVVHCPGYYMLGRKRFDCWLKRGHGDMNLQSALTFSCNTYFFTVGRRLGHEPIVAMAERLGLGQSTGIDLDADFAGTLPSAVWKRERYSEAWYEGDTCNLSIGQGPFTVTPLQMALVMSTIANGGTLYRPRLVLSHRHPDDPAVTLVPPRAVRTLSWSARSLTIVRRALTDVVMSELGTGRPARVPGVTAAGKTGTAEYGPKALGKKRGWMMAYAPVDSPRYVIAMVLDDARGGGVDAGPRVKRLLAGLFGVTLAEDEPEERDG